MGTAACCGYTVRTTANGSTRYLQCPHGQKLNPATSGVRGASKLSTVSLTI